MENQEKEMSFLAHLEVLRWHLVRSMLAIILFAVLAFFYKDIVFNDILFAPTNPDFISYRVFSSMSNFFGMGALSFDHLSSFSNLLNDALFAKFFQPGAALKSRLNKQLASIHTVNTCSPVWRLADCSH